MSDVGDASSAGVLRAKGGRFHGELGTVVLVTGKLMENSRKSREKRKKKRTFRRG